MCDQRDMDDKEPRLLLGLPSEIIQNELFGYLRHKDIVSISKIGSKRLQDLSEDHFNRNCTYYVKFHYAFVYM